jgi:uncharacterized membrane protein
MSYSIYKVIHLAAVIIFLGNIATGLFWKAHADRSSNPQIIAHTLHGIIRSDRWFTIPAIVVILIGGFGAASKGGLPILRTGWIFWSVVLFTMSGIAFSARVAPLQKQLFELAPRHIKLPDFVRSIAGIAGGCGAMTVPGQQFTGALAQLRQLRRGSRIDPHFGSGEFTHFVIEEHEHAPSLFRPRCHRWSRGPCRNERGMR